MTSRLGLGVLLLLAAATAAFGEQWGGIVPGETTMQGVRALHGGPTRTSTAKTDGFDTARWVYEGAQAPAGIRRLTVDFGLRGPAGFKAEVVRSLTLEPRPAAFTRRIIEQSGWGPPHGVGRQGESEYSFYKEGLIVYFEKDGEHVASMVFTPPQPPPPGKVEPRR